MKFAKTESFYCHSCDNFVVRSDDKSTGSFFLSTGHIAKFSQKGISTEGEYVSVVFAICKHCLPSFKLSEIG